MQYRPGMGSGYCMGKENLQLGSMVGARGWNRTDRKYRESGRLWLHSPTRILADDKVGRFHLTWVMMQGEEPDEQIARLSRILAETDFIRKQKGWDKDQDTC